MIYMNDYDIDDIIDSTIPMTVTLPDGCYVTLNYKHDYMAEQLIGIARRYVSDSYADVLQSLISEYHNLVDEMEMELSFHNEDGDNEYDDNEDDEEECEVVVKEPKYTHPKKSTTSTHKSKRIL